MQTDLLSPISKSCYVYVGANTDYKGSYRSSINGGELAPFLSKASNVQDQPRRTPAAELKEEEWDFPDALN